ncbi:MAG: hypothetical protein MK085_03445 [Phycisphaerales bacterium]|nr:hypothetical protein [Phycisphaerales bacterium]
MLACLLAVVLTNAPPITAETGVPLHSHNDYWRTRPLLDALAAGCISIEADVFAVDDGLAVAHDRKDIREGRTLRSMYLEPLAEIVRQRGRIYPEDPRPLYLVIDLKSGWGETAPVLREVLKEYGDILHAPAGTWKGEGGVIAVTSGAGGGRGRVEDGVAAVDGRPSDLGRDIDASAMPIVSTSYLGRLRRPKVEGRVVPLHEELKALCDQARAEGKLFRLWAAPDIPVGWDMLTEIGVGLINTDRPAAASKHLRAGLEQVESPAGVKE